MNHSTYLITNKVLPKFFVALLVAFVGMVLGAMFIPPIIAVFMPLVAIVLLIVAFVIKRKDSKITVGMPFVYFLAFILGIGIFPAVAYYVSDIGVGFTLLGFGITVVIFGALTLYAIKSKRDFSSLGAFLFVALLALIILTFVGVFIQATIFHLVLSFAGILIFSGYILYDISRMKSKGFTESDVPLAVLDLLLDFINILLDVLRLISIFKD